MDIVSTRSWTEISRAADVSVVLLMGRDRPNRPDPGMFCARTFKPSRGFAPEYLSRQRETLEDCDPTPRGLPAAAFGRSQSARFGTSPGNSQRVPALFPGRRAALTIPALSDHKRLPGRETLRLGPAVARFVRRTSSSPAARHDFRSIWRWGEP